jgi:dTDP-3-amino-3,4,6-trideoxy-alpha-D-glucose transaminase
LGDLKREYDALQGEIDEALARVLRHGWFILGREGEAFEAEWAAYCQVAQAVGVGNGTDALQLALQAVGVGPGDEVIVPALTAAFTAMAVSAAGATPVFADVDPGRYTLNPAAFEAAISPRTAAVIPVHLYGCPAEMEAIVAIARRHNLFVLEDAAQAHGTRYRGRRAGGLGDAAAFSFYPSKNLGAYGDAGAITTGDAALADKARMMRHGGQRQTYEHQIVGTNSRLDEIQAAILRVKLGHLEAWNGRRRALAARYQAGLEDCPGLILPAVPPEVEHVFHLYVVRTARRDELQHYLAERGVGAGIHYPLTVNCQPAYAGQPGTCPQAEAAAAQILSLPLFPYLDDDEVDRVVALVRSFFDRP